MTPRTALLGLTVALLFAGGVAGAQPAPPPVTIELLTMGPGEPLYTRFGHAAFLVRWPSGADVVFNYGYTDFADEDLLFDLLRGRARFWVARASYTATLRDYMRQDRTLYRQRLELSPEAAGRLARLLVEGAREENKYYVYNHFRDNCSTRLRDLLDRVLHGALAGRLRGQPGPDDTLRDLVRRGFAGRPEMLLVTDLVLGRAGDRRLSRWEACFLPRELRQTTATLRLGGTPLTTPPEVLYLRRAPSVFAGHDHRAVFRLLWLSAGLALALGLALVLGLQRRIRWSGLALVPPALVCGLAGMLLWPLVGLATLPELRLNELVLVLWPTDLLLLWPAVRWTRGRLWAGGLLRFYLGLRLAVLVLVGLGHVTGLLYQRPRAWLVLAAAMVLGAYLAVQTLPRRRNGQPSGGSNVGGGDTHGDQVTDSAGSLPGL